MAAGLQVRRRCHVVLFATLVSAVICALVGATAHAGAGHQVRTVSTTYDYDAPAQGVAAGLDVALVARTSTSPSAKTRTAAAAGERGAENAPRSWASSIPRSVAAKGASGASRTVTALTREQDTALAAVMRDSNRLEHIFGQGGKHNLGQLTQELGGQEAVVREAILRVPRSQPEGVFKLSSRIGPHPVTITGRMMDGVPRISNIWVPR